MFLTPFTDEGQEQNNPGVSGDTNSTPKVSLPFLGYFTVFS